MVLGAASQVLPVLWQYCIKLQLLNFASSGMAHVLILSTPFSYLYGRADCC